MAAGDVYEGMEQVAADGYLDIRPPVGVEAVVHNIYHEYDIKIVRTNGTGEIEVDIAVGNEPYCKFAFHVTNNIWIRVYNLDTANARWISFDGIKTKDT